jgi:hypothetical protein
VRLEHLLSGEDQTVNRILLKEMVAYPPGILHYYNLNHLIRQLAEKWLFPMQ